MQPTVCWTSLDVIESGTASPMWGEAVRQGWAGLALRGLLDFNLDAIGLNVEEITIRIDDGKQTIVLTEIFHGRNEATEVPRVTIGRTGRRHQDLTAEANSDVVLVHNDVAVLVMEDAGDGFLDLGTIFRSTHVSKCDGLF
jgi:hypothetical protein